MSAIALALCAASTWGLVFEVASVKRPVKPVRNIDITTSGYRLKAEAAFDIEARVDGAAVPSRDEARVMLRALLAERFRLRTHREEREMAVYSLEVGKVGRAQSIRATR